jgi:hypothetical protein
MQEIHGCETLYNALLITTAVKILLFTLLFVTEKRRFSLESKASPQQLEFEMKGKFVNDRTW